MNSTFTHLSQRPPHIALLVALSMSVAFACTQGALNTPVRGPGLDPEPRGLVSRDRTSDREASLEETSSPESTRQAESRTEQSRIVEENSYYSRRTAAILQEQIANDFPLYDTNNDVEPVESIGTGDPDPGPVIVDDGRGGFIDTSPPEFSLYSISVKPSFNGSATQLFTDLCSAGQCYLSDTYDVKSPYVLLLWQIESAYDTARLAEYLDDGIIKSLQVSILGDPAAEPLKLGSPFVEPFGNMEIFVNDGGCDGDMSKGCLGITIYQDGWYPPAPPWPTWHVTVALTKLEFSGPSLAAATKVTIVERTGTVTPPATLKNFFAVTIGISLLSENCQTCHILDTAPKLAAQHSSTSFITPLEKPSALVNGGLVLHCGGNCHESQISYLGEQEQFHEGRWASPTEALNINWHQIIEDYPNTWPSEVCNRMLSNMPTHEIRHEHFHEDSRLFWAVAGGDLPAGFPKKALAFPSDYGVFLKTFDRWNDSGAYCP